MKGHRSNMRVILGSFLSTWLICTPVWADDTEIYFGGSTTTAKPNVLFILDTSGSMQEYDGGAISRSDRMKRALTNVLNSATGINAGLMRFTTPGGPVLYPVENIDAAASSSTSSVTGSLSRVIRYGEDDAEQQIDGVVYTDSNKLELITPTNNIVFEKQVSSTNDTAEERTNKNPASVDTSSTDLELAYDGSTEQLLGIRFRAINIPAGATISKAYIEFTIDEYATGNFNAAIHGEAADNPVAYQPKNKDISFRTPTSAEVAWAVSNSPAVGEALQTPDLSSIVQELVSRPGWAAGNNMAFMIANVSGTETNRRVFESAGAGAPKLHIEYQTGVASGQAQTVGLRFNEITIPQGATITSASLRLVAGASNGASVTLTFRGEDTDHSEPFLTAPGNLSATTRPRTTAIVSWIGAPAWSDGVSYQSPELKAIVQEVVNRPNWCGGNSLSFFITANDQRILRAFEENIDHAAQLSIAYDVSSAASGACVANQYTANIAQASDDAEEQASGAMILDSTALDLGINKVGLRYQNIPLNANADITHAYIEFSADKTGNIPTSLTIKGHDTANAATFSTAANNINGRTGTTASVTWDPRTWSAIGEVHRSPNIAPIIEEIVTNTGWAPGNAIAFILEGSGLRSANAWDGSSMPPRLVYYTKPSNVTGYVHTVRNELINAIAEIPHKGGTPIVDTLYEAARYFRGEGVDYGRTRGSGTESTRALTRISHPGAIVDATENYIADGCSPELINTTACADEQWGGSPVYKTPIEESCQANYIVLLTDGEANSNSSASKIQTMTGLSSCAGGDADELCGLELANFLYTQDQNGSLTQDQIIRTYTIGLEFSTDWLKDLAQAGGGSFYLAESVDNLTNTFDTIIKQIKATNSTFVEPSVTINQFNRFAHRDDVYFALFKPQETAKWFGNLKKYQLKGSPAELYDNRNPQQLAVDPDTGFFGIDSKSFWSIDEDGNQVEKGGAASMLTNTRKVYTNVSTSSAVLSSSDNLVHESNALVTDVLLNIVGQTALYRENLIKWTRGLDANAAARKQLGDPLHSRPELVTYDGFSDPVESTIFFGTNEGYLHAVDIVTGQEQFAFIPKELLGNLDTFYTNNSVDPRPYGLDGGITLWTRDVNGDGDLKDSGEFAYLYVGMRRGGRSYYALDVSDINNPSVMWQIDGGSGDFAYLGQTWSKPIKGRVKIDNVAHDVLVFGGGYDPNQDNVSVRTVDSYGNAVFMVDALTGAKIWSAGAGTGHDETVADMTYGIPSEVKVLDLNRDGYIDQMYVGDMGGQVWRFDVDNEQVQVQHLVDVTKIADLAGSTAAENRRFYYPPDLALAVEGTYRYLSLGIGSGYRAHPLNTVINDRFYMIKLFDVYEKPTSFTVVTESELYDVTDNLIQQGNTTEQLAAQTALSNNHVNRKEGWMLRLTNPGEKVLSGSTTIQNQIVFTSYQPPASNPGSCNPGKGTSRAYLVSLFDATPMLDINKDGTTNKNDRVIQLAIGSIPATPTVIDTVDSKPTVWVGPERLDEVDTDVESVRTYWIEVVNP